MFITFKHIYRWPHKMTWERGDSRLKVPYGREQQELLKLLADVEASYIVIGVGMDRCDVRGDGWPYAESRPAFPGVLLMVDCRYGPLLFACDTFNTWRHNLHAIIVTLKGLRQIEAQGMVMGTKMGLYWPFSIKNGFEKWLVGNPFNATLSFFPTTSPGSKTKKPPKAPRKEQPPPTAPPSAPSPIRDSETFASRGEAANWLADKTGYGASAILSDERQFTLACRKAARLLHPDAGGDPADFRRLNHARDIIERGF